MLNNYMRIFISITVAVLISFLLSLNVFRFFPLDEMSLFLTVIGLIYGLIAAFTINNAWERFSKIRDAVSEETSSLLNLYTFFKKISDKPSLKKLSDVMVKYCEGVIKTEWSDYWSKEDVHKKFEELFDIVVDLKDIKPRNSILYEQCFDELREASTSRTQQLVLAQTKLSKIQWVLLLFLSMILIVSVTLLSMPIVFLSIFISAAMIDSVFLILIVIYELDSMSINDQEVYVEPYKKIINKIKKTLVLTNSKQ